MTRLKRFFMVIVDFFDGIAVRKIWTFAAAATFYLFLSLIPIAGLLCSLLPYTPLTEEFLLNFLDRVAPDSLYSLLSSIIESVYNSSAATLSITAVASVWTASMSVLSIMRGMDMAYDLKREENFIIFRLRACFFMIIMLATVLSTLCAIVYGEKILELIQPTFHKSWATTVLFYILRVGRYMVMMLVLFTVFLLFYRWMPAGKRKLFRQWPGALFTTIAWLVFAWVFSLYVSYSNRYGIYGILGTVIIALLWIYYCIFFLLAGAFINKFIHDEREKLREKKNAVQIQPKNGEKADG